MTERGNGNGHDLCAVGVPIMVRVRYPLQSGRLRLRTELDWERSVEPEAVEDDGTSFLFRFETERPYIYFKPVIEESGRVYWARGGNRLAVAGARSLRDVYPHFFSDGGCSVCDLRRLVPETARDHDFRVFLPPGYGENSLRRYSTLYLQDGPNVFFPNEAHGGQHWRVEETLRVLDGMNAIEEVIAIGVYPRQRIRDYTLPGYEEYGQFLAGRLKPALDAELRTRPEPHHTAVMGSSLGGVVSFYLAWEHPEVFGLAGCLSSSFGHRDDLFERVAEEPPRDVRIYLDSGWPGDNYEVTQRMRALLVCRGFVEGRDLVYLAFPNASHDEAAWALRSHIPFQLFFGHRPERPQLVAQASAARVIG